jgi:translation elongation factor P/translation initiation factor 5A
VKPGKGSAFVRTKLKNYVTGNTVERTFRGGETVDTAVVEKRYTQFTYMDGDDVSPSCDSDGWGLWIMLAWGLKGS